MAGERSAFRNRVEDLGLASIDAVAALLPGRLLVALVGGLSRVAYLSLGSRRRHSRGLVARGLNLPENGPQTGAIVRGAFRSLALNAVEPGIMDRRWGRGEAVQNRVSVEGAEHLQAALAAGKGVLLCGAHLGAWELTPPVLQHLFAPVWAMARSLDNPLLERRLLRKRAAGLRGTVPKDGGSLKMARILRDGEAIGLLLDQNAGQHGAILDFLGAPSSHHTVAGVMARRFGAAVLPVYMLREREPLRFRLVIEAPIEAAPGLTDDEAVLDITRRLSQSLEQQVRAHPEQWNWLHDRWRHAERAVRRAARQAAGEAAPSPSLRADDTHRHAAQGTNGT